jgi:hypothetical protein
VIVFKRSTSLLCVIFTCFLVSGCATKLAAGLSRETAVEVALQALRQQGFPTHREYTLVAKRLRGEWELLFDFEPTLPGNSMLVSVSDDRSARILPASRGWSR